MEAITYCEKLNAGLDTWKERADHVTRELDNMASCDKEKVLPEVIELHMFVEELRDRMNRVKKNCLEAWEPAEIGAMELRAHEIANWD